MEQQSQSPRTLRLSAAEHGSLVAKKGALARRITLAMGKDTPYLYVHERSTPSREGDHVYTESIFVLPPEGEK